MMVNKFASERVSVATGEPLTNGVYAAEVYFGWKLLEWKDGEWWHVGCPGRWTATAPVQFVGPLPARVCPEKPKAPAAQEFDL